MSNNANIMGVELNLNQEYIKASVEEIVKAGADKDAVARYVRGDLVNQLAAGVAEMMSLRMHYDPCAMVTIVEGEVWVEEPDRRTAFFGM